MMVRLAQWTGVFAVAAVLFVGTATAMAQDKARIIGFYVDVLDIYEDAAGEIKQREIEAADVKLPIDVIKVSPNYMMLVNIGGKQGWIYATIVETQGAMFENSDIGSCNQAVPDAFAGERNVGKQCGN